MMMQLLEANGVAGDFSRTRFIVHWDLSDASQQGVEGGRGILRHDDLVEVDVYSLRHMVVGVLREKNTKNIPKPSDSDDKLCNVRFSERPSGLILCQ